MVDDDLERMPGTSNSAREPASNSNVPSADSNSSVGPKIFGQSTDDGAEKDHAEEVGDLTKEEALLWAEIHQREWNGPTEKTDEDRQRALDDLEVVVNKHT